MNHKHIILIIGFVLSPILKADSVILGDKIRMQLLKQCGSPCLAGDHIVTTPDLGSTASEVASFAQGASHAVIVIDATQGPLPITREHVLIARQAGVASVSIFFANVSGLEGLTDAAELLELEELEVRELFNVYEMGGEHALVFHDNRLKGIPSLRTNGIGLSAVLAKLQMMPERQEVKGAYVTGKALETYAYLMTPQEAKHTESLIQGSVVRLWVNGQTVKATVTSQGLVPGRTGDLHFLLETPISAVEGSRYLLENHSQIIAAGVVIRFRR